jgi:prepilin-type N-terminal cleavage/methylation domain-containing protein
VKRGLAQHHQSRGFTLVELLVALALTGFVTLLMLDGIRLASLGLDRISGRAEQLELRRSIEELLRRELGSAFALPLMADEPGFVGSASGMRFLTLADERGAGIYRVDLDLHGPGGDRALVLTRQHVEPTGGLGLERSVLIRHLRDFRIAYFGARTAGTEPHWQERWDGARHLPTLVRITIDAGDGVERLPIVVRLWSAPG